MKLMVPRDGLLVRLEEHAFEARAFFADEADVGMARDAMRLAVRARAKEVGVAVELDLV
ncbi:hypothetical protein [Parvularcula dongshanensis]|uniref:hypothetical protein n=1 Tax=Parvularcula dongshanensis TaxID=1173995 RepID=UPI0016091BC0|nr:hypothetical protein [Parvularcula dongshanensis]